MKLPGITLQARLEAVEGRGSQREADPLRCVENILLARRVGSDLLILPIHVSRVVDQNGLFEVLGAFIGAWECLLRLESSQEGVRHVEIPLGVRGIDVLFVILAQTVPSASPTDERK